MPKAKSRIMIEITQKKEVDPVLIQGDSFLKVVANASEALK